MGRITRDDMCEAPAQSSSGLLNQGELFVPTGYLEMFVDTLREHNWCGGGATGI